MTSDIELGEHGKEKAVRHLVATVTAAIPVAGPIIQSLINEIVPDRRLERIEAFILRLQARLNEEELHRIRDREESLELFEEGLYQSSRSMNDQRREYIAALVATGISDIDQSFRARQYLRLLNTMDDAEIVILCSHLSEKNNGSTSAEEFHNQHRGCKAPLLWATCS